MGWVFLVPALYFVYVLVTTLHERIPLEYAPRRFLLDLFVVSLFPITLIRGRSPTILELLWFSLGDYFPMMLTIVGLLVVSIIFLRLSWRFVQRPVSRLSRRQKWLGSGIMFLLVGAWAVLPNLPTPPITKITVDVSQTVGKMPTHHRGFSQGGEGQMPQPGYFEAAMEQLAAVQPTLIRIDHIYDYYGVYSVDAAGKVQYQWGELDRVVDAILAAGASPFMSLSYMPPELARYGVYGPPSDFGAWEELVYQTVHHLNIERKLGIQYWEVWNEPNLQQFWSGTLEEYLLLYQAAARGALRADPTIKIGGPATASPKYYETALAEVYEGNWIAGLIQHTQVNQLPLDFISWHHYAPESTAYTRNVEQHQRWIAGLDPQPLLFLTEWNWNASVVPDNGVTVGYIAETVTALSDSPLDQAFFFEPIDGLSEWGGSWGLLRADGVPKAAFYAFRLLSNLSGERLSVNPGSAALASKEGDTVSVALWNTHRDYPQSPLEITFLGLPPGQTFEAAVYGVDAERGNPYYGSDDDLFIENRVLEVVQSGASQLTINVPLYGIRLVQFSVR